MVDTLRIQIVNYQTKNYLLPCLESIFADLQGRRMTYSVAILDNASGDDLSELKKRFWDLPITWQESGNNLGFGAGHNLLAKTATNGATYLLILNPDTKLVEPLTIVHLIGQALESNAQVVGPRLVTAKGTTQWWDHGELNGWCAKLATGSGHSYWRKQSAPTPAAWVSGAAFLIQTAWFDKLRGFDPNFFLYKEEEELCWRLRAMGGKVIYDPTVTILHHGGAVAKQSDWQGKSTAYFLKKHLRNKPYYPLLQALNAVIYH